MARWWTDIIASRSCVIAASMWIRCRVRLCRKTRCRDWTNMRTEIYWIPTPTPGRLAVMPRPRGGDWLEDEVRSWRAEGVDIAVSLLTPDETRDLDLEIEVAIC